MVAQSLSSAWHYSGINSADGKYTVEGWACQMKDVMIDHEDEFGTVCGTLVCKPATYLLSVLAGLSKALLTIFYLCSARKWQECSLSLFS